MKRVVVALGLALALALGAGAVAAQTSDLREAWVKAGPVQKHEVKHLVRTQYGEMPSRVVARLTEKDPRFFTQAALARLKAVRDKHPEAFTTLPAQVMQDVHQRYPRLISSMAIEFWSEVAAKDPTLVKDVRETRERGLVRALIAEKYPTLVEDVLALLKSKHPQLPAQIKRDVVQVVTSTDATLPLDVLLDTAKLLRVESPDGFRKILAEPGRRDRVQAFRGLLADNPQLAVKFWKMLDEKYADRIYTVAHAAVQQIGARHGSQLGALAVDVVSLVDQKHPSLPAQALQRRIASHQRTAAALSGQHAGFAKSFAARVQAKYPTLAADVLASIDKHAPGLRSDARAAVDNRFPGLREEMQAYVKQTWPDLEPKVRQILQ